MSGGEPRLFEARTAPFARWPSIAFVGAQVAFVAWMVLSGTFRLRGDMAPPTWALGLGVAVAWAAFAGSWLRPRRVRLEVVGEQLLVNGGRRVYPLSHVSVGEWREFGLAVRKGTVLHVGSGLRNLRIAVEDQLPPAQFAVTARPTTLVDVVVDGDAFGALRACLLEPSPPPFTVRSEAGRARRWDLTPNRGAMRNLLRQIIQNMVVMLLWSCGCVLLAGMFAPTRFEVSTLDPTAQGATMVVMAAGILGWPLLLWRRSGLVRYAIDLSDDGEARLVDTRREIVLARAAASTEQSVVARAIHVRPWWARGRGEWLWVNPHYGVFAYPVVVIQWPTGHVTSIGIHDLSFAWSDKTPKTREPAYLVGKSDWRALNEAMGLVDFVLENEHRARDHRRVP